MNEVNTNMAIGNQIKPNFEKRRSIRTQNLITKYTTENITEVENHNDQMLRERYRYLWNILLKETAGRVEEGQSDESFVSQLRVSTAVAMQESIKSDKDIMTGLPNRKSTNEALKRMSSLAHRHGKNLAVFYIDLDNFKTKVNDIFGHQAGDEVIKAAAELLTKTSRKSDMVGRLGGDEFILIGEDVDDQFVSSFKKRVVEEIEGEKFKSLNGFNEVSFSMGMYIITPSIKEINAEESIKYAETAMTKAKDIKDGRVKIVQWTQGMQRGTGTSRR